MRRKEAKLLEVFLVSNFLKHFCTSKSIVGGAFEWASQGRQPLRKTLKWKCAVDLIIRLCLSSTTEACFPESFKH